MPRTKRSSTFEKVDDRIHPKPVRVRAEGDGSYVVGSDERFHIVDESQWQADVIGPGSPDRWQVTDRSVPTSGCPNDDSAIIIKAPTQRSAAQQIAILLRNENGAHKPLVTSTPRSDYYRWLSDLRDGGRIDSRTMFELLDQWEKKHCEQFKPKDAWPTAGSERDRIMDLLRR